MNQSLPDDVCGQAVGSDDPEPGLGELAPLAESGPTDTGVVFPNDPYFWNGQPNLKAIGSTDAWGVSYGANDVVVAVISSGFDLTHPDIAGKLWRNSDEIEGNGVDDDANGYVDDVHGWNYAEAADGRGAFPCDFKGGTGTMSAGIIGAHTHNHIGVAGVSWGAAIMPIKVLKLDKDGVRGSFYWVLDAIRYAVDNGARVVLIEGIVLSENLLIEHVEMLESAVNYAHQAGAVVVAAAGDCGDDAPAWCRRESGSPAPIYPAALTHVIGVQAVEVGTLAQHSNANHGFWVDITAPGSGGFQTTTLRTAPAGVPCTDPGQICYGKVTYSERNGRAVSNFAAAHVAGAAAVLIGLNPAYSPLQVERLLCDRANRSVGGEYPQQPDGRFWNEQFGCGLLDLERAVDNATWVPRVLPESATLYTTGEEPGPSMVFESRSLNDGAWELRSTEPWVRVRPLTQVTGTPSRTGLAVDLESLALNAGGLQAGRSYTTEVQACPIPDARGPCQSIIVTVRIDPNWVRVLLPALRNR